MPARLIVRVILSLAVSAGLAAPAAAACSTVLQAQSAQPEWPKKIEKKLYAADFRGKKAPELQIEEMITGKVDRKGKVVMVDFWATWCDPRRGLIPEINKYQEQFKDDLVVIGISDEQPAVVRNFMKTTDMKYAQAIDTKGRTKKALNVSGIPHVIIMSTDGIVRWQGFPPSAEDPLTDKIIRQIIESDPGVQARRASEKKAGPGAPGQDKKDPGATPPASTPAPGPDRR